MQAIELTFRRAVRLVATPTPMRETATRASTKVKAATVEALWKLCLSMVIIRAIVIPPPAAMAGASRLIRYLTPLPYGQCSSYHEADQDSSGCCAVDSEW